MKRTETAPSDRTFRSLRRQEEGALEHSVPNTLSAGKDELSHVPCPS